MNTRITRALITIVCIAGCGELDQSNGVTLVRPNDAGHDARDGDNSPDSTSVDAGASDPYEPESPDTGMGAPKDMGQPGMGEPDAGTTEPDTGGNMPAPVVCGDGEVDTAEECDDGNTRGGDGCDANCAVERAYRCSGAPSACTPAPSPGSGDGMCEPMYGADVYDAFPGNNGSYPKGNSDNYSWPGDDFESYADDELVEASSNKGRRAHLNVTSGELYARHVNGSQLYKRGWTTTYNFRVLSRPRSSGNLVRLTDVEPAVRVHISDWQSGASATSGAHIFARYQTENDLYVASLRNDNKVTIKIKHCDRYTTLASANFSQGQLQTGKWYNLRFEVEGQFLRFWVDGNLELEAIDDTLSWGTTGVRTDYVDVYFDDWEHR